MDIVLNVNIDDLDLTEKIGGYYDDEGDFVGGKTVASAVIAELVKQATKGDYYAGLKKRVTEIRDEEIRVRIGAEIEAALKAPLQLTNGYGQPSGDPVTLTELIVKTAEKWLSETDRDRRTDTRMKRIDMLVRTQVEEALKDEIAAAVKAAKQAVTEQIGGSVAEVVSKAVRDGLNVR